MRTILNTEWDNQLMDGIYMQDICIYYFNLYVWCFCSFVHQKNTFDTQVHLISDILRVVLVLFVWVTLAHLPKLDIYASYLYFSSSMTFG